MITGSSVTGKTYSICIKCDELFQWTHSGNHRDPYTCLSCPYCERTMFAMALPFHLFGYMNYFITAGPDQLFNNALAEELNLLSICQKLDIEEYRSIGGFDYGDGKKLEEKYGIQCNN